LHGLLISEQRLYGVLFCNLVAVYAAKATILVFFYEVFPARLRAVLHFVTGLVLTTFLAGILATSFWCLPRRRMWDPTIIHSNDSCELRIVPSYNTLLFAMHTTTMVAVVILPMVLLRWVPGMRGGEVAFALSTLGFGAGSVVCSIITFHFILRTSVLSTDPCIKHAATLTILADQSAVFWAATLSAFRVRGRRKEAAGAGDGNGLVIEVESRFSVTVEIVSEWGHDWKDPWESGRLEHERMKVNTVTANR